MDRWKAEMGRVTEKRRVVRSTFRSQNVQSTPAPDHFWKLRCRKSARRCGEKHVCKWKSWKTPHVRSTFGSWDVEKVYTVVVRSTFASEKAKNTSRSEHFWKLRCRKSVRRCGAKHISKSKCTKNTILGTVLEEMSKKCTPLWREAHFEVKMYKTPHVHATFGRWDVVSRGRRKGLCTFLKVSKTCGFCSISKNDGRRGTFEDDLQRCIFRGRRSTRDMFIRAARRSGADFLRGVAFWSLRSSGLLRWFWVTGAAPRMTWHHFFVGAVV